MRIWTLFLLIGCSGDKDTATSDPAPPGVDWRSLDAQEAGPFSVGHRTLEHTYTAFEGDKPRTITVDVWYPTEDSSGDDAIYAYGSDALAFEDAAPAAPIHDGGYPVHLHSHGFQGWGATSSFMMRHFASHGWVAVAPNHVGNLLADHEDPLYTAHYIHKLRDLQESLDILPDAALAGEPRLDAVVLSGHSFGASYSTWGGAGARFDAVEETCANESMPAGGCTAAELAAFTSGTLQDDRVAAIIPMAGTVRQSFFGETGYEAVTEPVLFMSGTEDGPDSSQEQWETATQAQMLWTSLEGGCHQSFALGQCSTLDVELGYTIVNTYALAFARKHILGDDTYDSLLDATEQPWEEAGAQAR